MTILPYSWKVLRSNINRYRMPSGMEIWIYDDVGSGQRSVRDLHKFIATQFPIDKVIRVKANDVLTNLRSRCKLLCMPGGYDIGFLETLGEPGYCQIRQWVLNGGKYLGICAGAYFAADRIEFDKGGELEVCGDRPLKFFPGLAVGPLYPGFQYSTESGSRAAHVKLLSSITGADFETLYAYFNGAPYFVINASDENVTPLFATVEDGRIIGVDCKAGIGRAILTSFHFEFDVDKEPKLSDPLFTQRYSLLKENEHKSYLLGKSLIAMLMSG